MRPIRRLLLLACLAAAQATAMAGGYPDAPCGWWWRSRRAGVPMARHGSSRRNWQWNWARP